MSDNPSCLVACLLGQIFSGTSDIPSSKHLEAFTNPCIPPFTISQYVTYLAHHLNGNESALVIGLFYINKLVQTSPGLTINASEELQIKKNG